MPESRRLLTYFGYTVSLSMVMIPPKQQIVNTNIRILKIFIDLTEKLRQVSKNVIIVGESIRRRMTMGFCWCTIMVRNMQASLHFYNETLGLPVVRKMTGGPGPVICFLGEGETKIELVEVPDAPGKEKRSGIAVGFDVASLEQQMELIRKMGYEVESGPFSPAPNVRFFYVLDPDGVKVQFVKHVGKE
ncbi:MAG: hypothetical protein CVU86_06645 [Firmicutes bacterium HGW-Firmicutes-11]|nr:MAG: hypothetical protein CVU86_06645 [Firmicutes bacterium HGW-Firmicutes-11]